MTPPAELRRCIKSTKEEEEEEEENGAFEAAAGGFSLHVALLLCPDEAGPNLTRGLFFKSLETRCDDDTRGCD